MIITWAGKLYWEKKYLTDIDNLWKKSLPSSPAQVIIYMEAEIMKKK